MNIFKDIAARKYKFALWSMTLGIMGACLSLVTPGGLPLLMGILALAFALSAKRDYFTIETSTASTIGLVTGIVATVLSGLVVLIPIILLIIALVVGAILLFLAILPDLIRALRQMGLF